MAEQAAALGEELRKTCEGLRDEVHANAASLARSAETLNRLAGAIPHRPAPFGQPCDAWIDALPENERNDGFRVCAIWRDMIDLRNQLRWAAEEREVFAGNHAEEARRVMDVRMWDLRSRIESWEEDYRAFAGPFFARHGHPPMAGVGTNAARRTRSHFALDDLDRRLGIRPSAPPEIVPQKDAPWTSWLEKIPSDRRSVALRVRVLFDDLSGLRERLHELVAAKRRGEAEVEERIQAMKPDIFRADVEYRRLAEPLFEKFGKPESS